MRKERAVERVKQNINPSDPLRVVRKLNLPFGNAANLRVVLSRVDINACLPENLVQSEL